MAATFPLLYPNRIQGILRPPGCKTWTTVSKHWTIEDETILSAVAGEEKNLWGLRWGEQSKFAVFDIDQGSKYHQAAELQKLQTKLAAIGLRATAYRSSERGGWHLYLFLDDWTDSNDLRETLKKWLYGHDYEIRNGTLEVFPSGMGLRLPLQRGFGWLDDNAELIAQREELTRDAAISRFLLDLESNAGNWSHSKRLIETELEAKGSYQGASVQAHEKAIDTDGFEQLFNYRLIHEKYQEGRQYWHGGLTAKGQRHDAVLAIEHYFWHGDSSAGVPALPGEWNDEQRYRLILAWLKENHNGYCNHINRGNWRKVEAQIRRSVKWRRPSGGVQVRIPYALTERSIEVLIAKSKATGRTWTPEDLKKGNDGREEGARKRISVALQLLIDQGKRLTVLGLSRASGCSRTTVRRHLDIWMIPPAVTLSKCTGDQNPFLDLNLGLDLKGAGGTVPGGRGPLAVGPGTGSEEENLNPRPCSGDSGDLDFTVASCSADQASEIMPLAGGRSALASDGALEELSEHIVLWRLTPYAETLRGDGEQLNGKVPLKRLPPSDPPSLATGSIAGALSCRLEPLGTCGINGFPPTLSAGPSHLILGDFCKALRARSSVALGNYCRKANFSIGAQYANLTARGEERKRNRGQSRAPPRNRGYKFLRGRGTDAPPKTVATEGSEAEPTG